MSMTFEPLSLPYSASQRADRLAGGKPAAPSADGLSGDKIKDYIIERMTARIKGYDAEGLDAQMLSMGLMPAFGGERNDTFSSPSSNLSSLLNMHFDLNTLQMLNKT